MQAVVVVPVATALGLSNEPAWLDGYGFLAAPSSRLLLPDPDQLAAVDTDQHTPATERWPLLAPPQPRAAARTRTDEPPPFPVARHVSPLANA